MGRRKSPRQSHRNQIRAMNTLTLQVRADPDGRTRVTALDNGNPGSAEGKPNFGRRQAKHFTFKGTNVVVPYLQYTRLCPDGKRRSYFTLFYRDETGARRRETRSTFAKAQARAE